MNITYINMIGDIDYLGVFESAHLFESSKITLAAVILHQNSVLLLLTATRVTAAAPEDTQ